MTARAARDDTRMIVTWTAPRRRAAVATLTGGGGRHMARRFAGRGGPIVAGDTGHSAQREVTKARPGPGRRRVMTSIAGGVGGNMVGRLTGAGGLAASLVTKYTLDRRTFEYAVDMTRLTGGALVAAVQRETADRVVEVRWATRIGSGGLPQQQQYQAEQGCCRGQRPRSSSAHESLHYYPFLT